MLPGTVPSCLNEAREQQAVPAITVQPYFEQILDLMKLETFWGHFLHSLESLVCAFLLKKELSL